ncbi:Subtilase family protein [Mameliella alba]|uniref:S8 family serine peptidase n=1 Tax=Mameliella alba TaxID=561184 RepID=UPI00088736B5|nr:S8 family serine peptidase [Mameliella alba]OWV40837.1 hypothetical protein CDZ96_25660 [Mameliella alba]PTR33758.1 subtilase family protein [Mameliella alba]GGF85382.1 hypothetical protein GCM10011319_51580 [Mameliella alba]SDE30666.1 Subtilase family protein [Mameliella alba]
MGYSWTDAREHAFRDACLDWSRLIGLRRDMLPPMPPDRGPDYAPLFVHLHSTDDMQAARRRLRDLVGQQDSPLRMDDTELAALVARIDDPQAHPNLPDSYMLYRRIGTADSLHDDLFEVIDSGCPVQLANDPMPPEPAGAVPPSPTPGAPIVAIIDDGIGFLNARFCRGTAPRRTRFHALWLQALEQQARTPKGTLAGRILDTAEIDDLLARGDESTTYAALNAAIYPDRTRDETGFATTHGTHVLDLAAGADPENADDPARDWPLLGVQLPPESIDDTSGTWVESYLVMGLRWILRQAARVDATAPVIVNVSLGVLAGPKDGTHFVEHQMAREAQTWEEVTGQPVRLVWAFGNSYRSSQVARLTPTEVPAQLDWRVQPDDETASFIEIHCRNGASADLQLGLTAPDGTTSGLAQLQPGEIRSLEREDGAALARVYHVPARKRDKQTEQQAYYVLALAPTRGQKAGEPEAPAGAWIVSLQGSGEVLVQVQRDDAIRGSEVRGRQSYLDHPAAYDWDESRAGYVAPGAGPISDEGCHNAYVAADCRQVFSVGAAQASAWTASSEVGNYRPAPYSGEGASWSQPGPSVAARIGTGPFSAGIRASGTLSGSTRRLAGTSAAAGRLTRALALSSTRIVANAQNPTSTRLEDIDPACLVPTGTRDSRLGEAVVELPDALPAS